MAQARLSHLDLPPGYKIEYEKRRVYPNAENVKFPNNDSIHIDDRPAFKENGDWFSIITWYVPKMDR